MSFLLPGTNNIEPQNNSGEGFDPSAQDVQPYGYLDLFKAAGDAASRYVDPGEQYQNKLRFQADNIRAYEATGRDFYKDIDSYLGDSTMDRIAIGSDSPYRPFKGPVENAESSFDFSANLKRKAEIYEQFFLDKSKEAGLEGLFKTPEQIIEEIKQFEGEKKTKYEAVKSVVGDGVLPTLTELAAGALEQGKDLDNLATLFLGGGGGTVLKAAARAALENVAIEAIQYGEISDYNENILDEEYGLKELGISVATAATFGAVVGGAGKAIGDGLQARKTRAEVLDEISFGSKSAGDEVLSTIASTEADRMRIQAFNIADEVNVRGEGAISSPTRTILEGKQDITKVTRAKIDLGPGEVMRIDLNKVADPDKKIEIAELQDLIRNSATDAVDSPIAKNEFTAAERETLDPQPDIEGSRKAFESRAYDEAKGVSSERIRYELDGLSQESDPVLKRVVDDAGFDPKKLKLELESLDRTRKAISFCGSAR